MKSLNLWKACNQAWEDSDDSVSPLRPPTIAEMRAAVSATIWIVAGMSGAFGRLMGAMYGQVRDAIACPSAPRIGADKLYTPDV